MQAGHEQRPPAATRAAAAAGHLQVVVVALAALLPLRPTVSGIPLSTVAAAALVVLASVRRSSTTGPVPWVPVVGIAGAVLWTIGISTVLHGPEVRRTGNLLILLALGWVLTEGRLHRPSVVAGLSLGLFGGIGHAVLTRGSSDYAGRITGYLGDPNGAGFVIVTIGCVLVGSAVANPRRARLIWLAVAVAVLLTVSRTSTFAFAVATVWALAVPRLGRIRTVIAAAIAWPTYQFLVGVARDSGFFAERVGSDNLRQRLAVVEKAMVDEAGWFGLGLDTARAEVDTITLWFHNSYRALEVEGGTTALALLGLGIVGLAWGLHRVPADARNGWFEGAVVAGLVCSVNIGFSLTSVSMAVALGFYLNHWRDHAEEVRRPGDDLVVPLLARDGGRGADREDEAGVDTDVPLGPRTTSAPST